MKVFFTLLISCIFLQSVSLAQSSKTDKPTYKTAIGLRYTPLGVSFKANSLRSTRSVEVIGYFDDGFLASALLYWNYTVNDAKNIRLYAGFGAQGGVRDDKHGGDGVFGAAGILGADYKFLHLPINISLDWQPAFQFSTGKNDFNGNYGGVAVRFTL